ncbi:MAG: DUF1850 domain-containing protein [Armatimonadota bacterium]|nr:DUF1850 domain-containing protein [Armatimonadota bacterium]
MEVRLAVATEQATQSPGWVGPDAVRGAGRPAVRISGLRPGTSVELRYQHTVERTPVVEVFRAERDGLWFVEARFASQGAGLPSQGYVREGDHYVLRRPHRIGALAVRISARAGHRLRVGDREADLVEAFGDGAGVVVTAGLGRWQIRR